MVKKVNKIKGILKASYWPTLGTKGKIYLTLQATKKWVVRRKRLTVG